MAYRSKKEALASIKERKHVRNGQEYSIYETFLGYENETRKQKRLSALTKEALRDKIAEFYDKLDKGGVAATTFTIYEATDARAALDMIAQHSLGLTLCDCVRRVMDGTGKVVTCTTSVGEAYKLFMASHIGKSPDYIKTLKSRVGTWVKDFGGDRLLSDITAQETTEGLRKRLVNERDQGTWTTYNNHLGDIKTFVGWCAKPERRFIAASPLEGVSGLAVAYKEPEYVKAGDVEKLFRTLEKHKEEAPSDLADAILSFFCGIRQSEIMRARYGDGAMKIDIAEGFIRVVKVKGTTHGTRPRAFKLSEQALAWMRSFDFTAAIATKNAKFRVHLTKRAKEAGITLPKNAGRHTFITMHAAAYHDQNLLTSIVGNTEGVRASSYDGIEVEKNGKAYFAIMPQNAPRAA